MSKFKLLLIFLICASFARAQTSTSYDFNTSDQLTTFFNGFGPGLTSVSQVTTGGINNSGSITVPLSDVNAIYSTKDSYSLGPIGSTYTFQSFIKSEGNSGYSGMGFTTSSPVSSASSGVYRPSVALGVSVHGGGFVFHNGVTDFNGSWAQGTSGAITAVKSSSISDLLNSGSPDKWFKIILKVTKVSASTFDMRVEVWPSLADGTIIRPNAADAIFELRSITNTAIQNAPVIYSYFNFSGTRVTRFDNYSINLGGGATVVQQGAPVVLTTSSTLNNDVVTINGDVTSANGTTVIERGFVYGTATNPTTSDNKVVLGSGVGAFSGNTASLTPGTYYFRSFATNSTGTSYGAEFSQTIAAVTSNCNNFDQSDFQLNGNATVANSIVTLTTNTGGQRGGAWNRFKLSLDNDFEITSKLFLGNSDAGADGVAFVLQNQSINAGSSGGGLGYAGITPSFAVEFDTYFNGGVDPGNGADHIAVIRNGNAASITAHSEFAAPYYVEMEDGQWHDVKFVWSAATKNFQVWYDGVKRFDVTVDLKATVFNNADYVYWGFTGATGGSTNLQQVEMLQYCTVKQTNLTLKPGTNNAAAAATFCSGADVQLEATPSASYQWYKNNVAISGETQRTLTVNQSGSYTVSAVSLNGGNTSLSEPTVVTVNPLPAFTYPQTTYSFIRGNAIATLATVNTGIAISSYAISANLPSGLSFSATTGTITGTPTAVSASTAYIVTATSATGCSATYTISVGVINDTPPSNMSFAPAQQTVRQGAAITSMSPTVSGGSVISYSISPALPTGLTFNTTTGVISGTLSVNKTGTEVYTITATNSGGSTTATITLIYNTAPTDISLSTSSINENNVANAVVGNLTTTDADAGDTFTYTLVSGSGATDNASFTIAGNQLKAAATFDFEAKNSYSVRVRTTDAGGLTFEKVFVIAINDINEAPTNITLSANSINENNALGLTIGNLTSTDVDAGDTFTYTLVSGTGATDNASFTIAGNQLKAAATFDFEAKNSYSVRVRTTDARGLSFEKVFTININDVNEAPTNIALSNANLFEGNATGANIGTLTSTDQDAGSIFSYTLVSGDVTAFNISGNTLRASNSFNFSNKNSYAVRIKTTDAGGLSFEKDFTITISQVPVIIGTGNQVGTNIPMPGSNNPEISKGLTSQFTVIGSGYTNYSWSPSTGLSNSSIPNPIAKPLQTTTYTLTVTNAFGNRTSVTITVVVNDDYFVIPNNILTPNGDGQNDTWVVGNIANYPNNEVKIFDRTGRLVYTKKGYNNEWNAPGLNQGVFYYIISFGNNTAIKKGAITLIR